MAMPKNSSFLNRRAFLTAPRLVDYAPVVAATACSPRPRRQPPIRPKIDPAKPNAGVNRISPRAPGSADDLSPAAAAT
jgi:hypothetical protein